MIAWPYSWEIYGSQAVNHHSFIVYRNLSQYDKVTEFTKLREKNDGRFILQLPPKKSIFFVPLLLRALRLLSLSPIFLEPQMEIDLVSMFFWWLRWK